jgi:hypothetical protein
MEHTECDADRPDLVDLQANQVRWPRPAYDRSDEPHFVFILTSPYTGSTTIAKYLATSPNIGLLRENGEGQKLVPGIHRNWDANAKLDGESIRSTWLNRYQQINSSGGLEIIVEKSPPNMLRIDTLRSLFRRTTCLVNNRDPVAFCSSTFYRNTPNAGQLNEADRLQLLQKMALTWVRHSIILKDYLSDQSVLTCSYEKFCESPESLEMTFEKATGEAINPDKDPLLKIKDYLPFGIENKNMVQVSRFSEIEIEIIVKTLLPYSNLTSFFGYAPESWLSATN